MQAQHLKLQANFGIPGERYRHPYMPGDQFYDMLMQAQRDLDDDASAALQARLLLLLANHIGDLRVLEEAVALARRGVQAGQAGQQA